MPGLERSFPWERKLPRNQPKKLKIPIGKNIERLSKWKHRLVGAAILALLLLSLGIGCFARTFNHDESQFVASGALLVREGLLPYLHYPYFHLPNLVFIYAALFSTNDFLLLTARSFNIVCASLLLLLVYYRTASAFRFLGERRWLVGSAAALLLVLNPLFRFTAGRAWNHDLTMLATVAALAAFFCERLNLNTPSAG